MKRISSKYTFFYKKLFPVFWFAIVVLVSVVPLVQPSARRPGPEIILMPAFMGIIGFVVMKRLIIGLVDEAWDDGDSLVFRNASQEVRVYLKDIKNVNYQLFVNPPRSRCCHVSKPLLAIRSVFTIPAGRVCLM